MCVSHDLCILYFSMRAMFGGSSWQTRHQTEAHLRAAFFGGKKEYYYYLIELITSRSSVIQTGIENEDRVCCCDMNSYQEKSPFG